MRAQFVIVETVALSRKLDVAASDRNAERADGIPHADEINGPPRGIDMGGMAVLFDVGIAERPALIRAAWTLRGLVDVVGFLHQGGARVGVI